MQALYKLICPGGEIGKRCGLRSRWSYILESSSLFPGTNQLKLSLWNTED